MHAPADRDRSDGGGVAHRQAAVEPIARREAKHGGDDKGGEETDVVEPRRLARGWGGGKGWGSGTGGGRLTVREVNMCLYVHRGVGVVVQVQVRAGAGFGS